MGFRILTDCDAPVALPGWLSVHSAKSYTLSVAGWTCCQQPPATAIVAPMVLTPSSRLVQLPCDTVTSRTCALVSWLAAKAAASDASVSLSSAVVLEHVSPIRRQREMPPSHGETA